MINPLIAEVSDLLKNSGKTFWLAGGYAIDSFLMKETRKHDDLDFVIKRSDQLFFQEVLLDWDLQAADPPGSGSLQPWVKENYYDLPVHNVWCRKNEVSPWDLELLFSEFESDEWVYRRNRSIRGSIASFGWQAENGLMVIAPEIQLLYKSRGPRPKDVQDLNNCLMKMNPEQKEKLKNWIVIDSGQSHPWLKLIQDE